MYISTILFSLVSLPAIGDAIKQEQDSKLSPSIIVKSSLVPPSTPDTKRTAQKVLSGHVKYKLQNRSDYAASDLTSSSAKTDRIDFSVNVDDQCRRPSNDGEVDESSWNNASTWFSRDMFLCKTKIRF
jgi:hypothetical protein